MGLEEFGTEVDSDPNARDRVLKRNAEITASAPTPPGAEGPYPTAVATQFALTGDGEYMAVGPSCATLPAGVYKQSRTNKGIVFNTVDIKVDDLIELPDSLHKSVLDEIAGFWTRGKSFKDYGFLHRRGYMLYGPAGGGKTCIVQQVVSSVVRSGDIVMMCQVPEFLVDALTIFRRIDPNRRIVCVFEDIDAIVRDHGEDRILALLDGENQIDRVLNIATTNYPERLDQRIVARPRRFDRVIYVGMPSDSVRETYLRKKLGIDGAELREWVDKSNDFSFAALAEMVISVKCLGNSLEDTVEILKEMAVSKVSSDDFKPRKTGFAKIA